MSTHQDLMGVLESVLLSAWNEFSEIVNRINSRISDNADLGLDNAGRIRDIKNLDIANLKDRLAKLESEAKVAERLEHQLSVDLATLDIKVKVLQEARDKEQLKEIKQDDDKTRLRQIVWNIMDEYDITDKVADSMFDIRTEWRDEIFDDHRLEDAIEDVVTNRLEEALSDLDMSDYLSGLHIEATIA